MPEMLNDIVAELEEIDEGNEKLKFLLSLGTELPKLPENEKNPQTKISGCASNAYVIAKYRKGKMYFRGDSDAQIPKGILALFIMGCEGATPKEILELNPDFLEKTGLKNLLSPSRANGAYHIYKRIKEEAQRYFEK